MGDEKSNTLGVILNITDYDELRVTDIRDNMSSRQKKVHASNTDPVLYFNFDELKQIAIWLHNSPEFRKYEFKECRNYVINLGWTLYNVEPLDRASLVAAMLLLMNKWMTVCRDDIKCIAPPSLATLGDPQQRKIIAAIEALKRSKFRDILHVAQLKKANGQQLSTVEQQVLEQHEKEEENRMK